MSLDFVTGKPLDARSYISESPACGACLPQEIEHFPREYGCHDTTPCAREARDASQLFPRENHSGRMSRNGIFASHLLRALDVAQALTQSLFRPTAARSSRQEQHYPQTRDSAQEAAISSFHATDSLSFKHGRSLQVDVHLHGCYSDCHAIGGLYRIPARISRR